MKTITFTYKKADNSISERTLLATTFPGDKYAGIDLSSLDPTKAVEFTEKAQELQDAYIEQLQELQAAYDLKYNYRQFFEAKMSDVEEI